MQMNNTGMVEHIVNEFQKRKSVNPTYSLRAFSRDIGVDQSLMTKIIKGKRKVSVDLTLRLSNMFNLESQNYSKEA
jgi:plasmid maintenance system antidote protein VapI